MIMNVVLIDPVLINITLQKHFITIMYPVTKHWSMWHIVTDIIVTDQSHRYIYVTSEAADSDPRNHPDPLTPTSESEKFGLWMKMEPKGLDHPLVGVPGPVMVSNRDSSSRRCQQKTMASIKNTLASLNNFGH